MTIVCTSHSIKLDSASFIMHIQSAEMTAVARGKDGEAGLSDGTSKMICLKVPLNEGKQRAIEGRDRGIM